VYRYVSDIAGRFAIFGHLPGLSLALIGNPRRAIAQAEAEYILPRIFDNET
jgi:hypothetical protein